MSESATKNKTVAVIKVRELTSSTYIVRLERGGLEFEAGQYISLGLPGAGEKREYSIYSGIHDEFLEVLVKEIDDGLVSRQLKYMKPGARVELDGPFGFFSLGKEPQSKGKYIFIASGTGIAPFHSFIKSYPGLDYRLIHGVRFGEEAYESSEYEKGRHVVCTSGDRTGDHPGRITAYLETEPLEKSVPIYLCGNSNMIYDVYDILTRAGHDSEDLHAEVYF